MGMVPATRSIDDQVKTFGEGRFGSVIRSLRLSPEQIATQTIEELDASLDRVNDAIAHSAEFGTYALELTANARFALVASGSAKAHVTVSILPLLLDAKTLIIDRIRDLRPNEQLSALQEDIVQNITDPLERERIDRLFEERRQANAERERQLAREAVQNAVREQRLAQELREKEERLKLDIMLRRSEIRRSYLARDTVAGAVGPILLLGLGGALVVAMFVHTTVSATVSDSFLLILGYFFGNATTQKATRARKAKAPAQTVLADDRLTLPQGEADRDNDVAEVEMAAVPVAASE